MTETQEVNILRAAAAADITVTWAKYTDDIEVEGIHILEPTYQDVLDALLQAVELCVGTVVIHSKVTWVSNRRGPKRPIRYNVYGN